jgi:lipoprotein-releasing system permease protein
LNLGLRYAWSGRSLSSFIGVVAVAGLVLSVAVLLIVTSVMNGFERELRERVLGVLPHVTLRASEPFRNWRELSERVAKVPGVVGVAPFVDGPGLVVKSGKSAGVTFTGIEPELQSGVSDASRYANADAFTALEPGRWGVVLGAGVAARLGADVGDSVVAVLPEASVSLIGITPRQKRLSVVGILKTASELDARAAYLAIADAARLFRAGDGAVHGLEVRLNDVFAADTEAARLIATVGSDRFYAVSWTRTHGSLYRAIAFQRAVMFLLLSLLVAVAAFNLVSALVMIVNQRRGDVAVLRTMGAGSRTIVGAFVALGSLIGLGGVGIGIALGVAGSLLVQDGYAWLERTFSIDLMNQYFVTYLPSELRVGDVVRVGGVALALSIASTLYPALRAGALRPAEVLRHE